MIPLPAAQSRTPTLWQARRRRSGGRCPSGSRARRPTPRTLPIVVINGAICRLAATSTPFTADGVAGRREAGRRDHPSCPHMTSPRGAADCVVATTHRAGARTWVAQYSVGMCAPAGNQGQWPCLPLPPWLRIQYVAGLRGPRWGLTPLTPPLPARLGRRGLAGSNRPNCSSVGHWLADGHDCDSRPPARPSGAVSMAAEVAWIGGDRRLGAPGDVPEAADAHPRRSN